jgi:hypothetical protein
MFFTRNPIILMKGNENCVGHCLDRARTGKSWRLPSRESQVGVPANLATSDFKTRRFNMSISGIGSQSGFDPSQMAAQSGGGGGGAQKSGATGGSSSSSGTYDVKDTNKDGTVSLQEEMAYAIKHPDGGSDSDNKTSTINALLEEKQKGQQYDSQGSKSVNANETKSLLLNLYA